MLVEMACYLPTNVVTEKLGGTPQCWAMDDAQVVLQSLDQDGNGTIERDEFIDWTIKGMKKFKDDPTSMDANPMHDFFTSIICYQQIPA